MREEFELQLPDLLYFVKASCHENLHDTLSELRMMNENKVLPKKLSSFIRTFIQDLQRHLAKEENHLFPFIEKGRTKTTDSSINGLVDEHDKMKLDLMAIRQMTNNYQENIEDNVEKTRFYEKLKEMDRIILNHIQIENHVLFPMLMEGEFSQGR
jgi:iron-sulfur cluster repair protein YtfE (RIC family)